MVTAADALEVEWDCWGRGREPKLGLGVDGTLVGGGGSPKKRRRESGPGQVCGLQIPFVWVWWGGGSSSLW